MYRGLQIPEDVLWEHRICSEYIQKFPDWTPEDHEEEEEYQKYFKLESLAEALGYITKKND